MSEQHTPGPWKPFILDMPLNEVPAYVQKCITASGEEEFYFVTSMTKDGERDICHVGNGPKGNANAHLISASPSLYAAAKQALLECPELMGTPAGDALDKALKQARGEA
jgi:hypothetical protein